MSIKFTKLHMRKSVSDKETLRDARIGQHLRDAYTSPQTDDTAFAENLARARRYAQEFNLVADQHILDVVECCFLLGGSVYQHQIFQRIMSDPMRHNEEKCQALRDHVIAPHLAESA